MFLGTLFWDQPILFTNQPIYGINQPIHGIDQSMASVYFGGTGFRAGNPQNPFRSLGVGTTDGQDSRTAGAWVYDPWGFGVALGLSLMGMSWFHVWDLKLLFLLMLNWDIAF